MKTFSRVLLIFVVLCVCVGCDQATKTLARQHLVLAAPITLLGDTVRLHYTENQGSFLGLGARLPEGVRFWVFIVCAGLMVVLMFSFALTARELNRLGVTGAALIIGGGFSNLLDRIIRNGRVADFMNIGIGNVRTGIFNVADVVILIGIGLLLVSWPRRSTL
ncbi:MAG TPA: signal peptidase II [Anaerolineae bacterium]|nr:signal peptidase II [Anaerolineae bacterium]HQK15571.1 signal peptidase II [Anaerolineae bacterium]